MEKSNFNYTLDVAVIWLEVEFKGNKTFTSLLEELTSALDFPWHFPRYILSILHTFLLWLWFSTCRVSRLQLSHATLLRSRSVKCFLKTNQSITFTFTFSKRRVDNIMKRNNRCQLVSMDIAFFFFFFLTVTATKERAARWRQTSGHTSISGWGEAQLDVRGR